MPSNAMVDFTGVVFWSPPVRLLSSCKVDITFFPFDEQVCGLKFGSWTYDQAQVKTVLDIGIFCNMPSYTTFGCDNNEMTLSYSTWVSGDYVSTQYSRLWKWFLVCLLSPQIADKYKIDSTGLWRINIKIHYRHKRFQGISSCYHDHDHDIELHVYCSWYI